MLESWPSEGPDPVAFWRAALGRVADRVAQERGVREDADVYEGDGVLSAWFGDLRLRLGPDDGETGDESDLFDRIDEWVAFDREAGPGRVLDRDRERAEQYRALLLSQVDLYQEVAPLFFADVAASTTLEPRWRFEVRERPTRFHHPLPDPELVVFCAAGEFQLTDVDSELDALVYLIEALQDHIIEEVHGAWPECPEHGHPLFVETDESGRAVWSCPRGAVSVPVGRLASLRP